MESYDAAYASPKFYWGQEPNQLCRRALAFVPSVEAARWKAVDLIYSSGTLTFIPPQRRPEVFAHYKRQTRVGGIHAFNAFVEKPFIPTAPDWSPDEFFYRSGELLAYYWDWEILACEEVTFDCNSSGVPHRHAMDVLIARKVTAD